LKFHDIFPPIPANRQIFPIRSRFGADSFPKHESALSESARWRVRANSVQTLT
jgi:hypothetical protein